MMKYRKPRLNQHVYKASHLKKLCLFIKISYWNMKQLKKELDVAEECWKW